jgi:hypothetical protein
MKSEDKIGFMHGEFGAIEGKCKNCSNFKRWKYGDTYLRKCRVYGISHSNATDWKGGFQACGMYNKSPDGIGNLYKRNSRWRKNVAFEDRPLRGQIEFKFDGGEE